VKVCGFLGGMKYFVSWLQYWNLSLVLEEHAHLLTWKSSDTVGKQCVEMYMRERQKVQVSLKNLPAYNYAKVVQKVK
jgi:hypothetical protein